MTFGDLDGKGVATAFNKLIFNPMPKVYSRWKQ
jgi:hypothetical protein